MVNPFSLVVNSNYSNIITQKSREQEFVCLMYEGLTELIWGKRVSCILRIIKPLSYEDHESYNYQLVMPKIMITLIT